MTLERAIDGGMISLFLRRYNAAIPLAYITFSACLLLGIVLVNAPTF